MPGATIAELTAVITAETSGFDSGMSAADAKVKQLAGTAQSTERSMQAVGLGMAAVGAAAGVGLGTAINAAADFEFQMDAVNAALGGLDPSGMAAIEAQALSLGASSKFSAGEIAGVQEALGKAGIGAETLLSGATQAVTDLAAATGEDLVAAGEAAAAAINLFGLEGEQIAGVADTITAGLNNSSATLSDFRTGVNNLGPVMTNLAQYAGKPEEAFSDTAAAVAYFNAQGLKAADAGVSLARGMTNLADPTSDASAVMEDLGIAAFDAQGNFLPLPDIMDQLNGAMSGMSDQAREAALATIFGAEAADVMNIAIKNGGDGLREYEALMVSQGQAAEQAAIRQENLSGAMEALGGSVETAAIALGTSFVPVLTKAAQGVTKLVNVFLDLPKPVQTTVAVITALVAVIGTGLGGAILIVPKLVEFHKALQLIGAGGKVAALGMRALTLAMGPVGIAIAAIGLAVLAYETNFLGFRDAVHDVADALGPVLGGAARAAGDFLGFLGDRISDAVGWVQQLAASMENPAFRAGFLASLGEPFRPLVEGVEFVIGRIGDLRVALDGLQMPQGLRDLGDWLQKNVGDRIKSVIDRLGDAKDALGGIELPEGLRALGDWFGSKFGTHVDAAIAKLGEFQIALGTTSTESQNKIQEASDATMNWLNEMGAKYIEGKDLAEEHAIGTGVATRSIHELITGTSSWTGALQENAKAIGVVQQAEEELSDLQKDMISTYQQGLIPAVESFSYGMTRLIPAGNDVLDVLANLEQVGVAASGGMAAFLDGMNDARQGIEGVMVSLSALDAMGASLESAQGIAQKLVGDPGTLAVVDDLLAKGLISVEQLIDAQADEIRIVEANARAQDALNVMRLGNIDSLANQSQAYSNYLVQLSQLPEAEQQHALAMMDTANQAKLASAASAVYSASLGEIPKEVVTGIITNAAAADPVLFDILTKYGLIERGAQGEVVVNFPDASEAALARFTEAFAGDDVKMIDGLIRVEQSNGTTLVYDQFNNLVEQSGSVIEAEIDIKLNDLSTALASGAGFGAGMSGGIGESVAESVTESVERADYSGVTTAVQTSVTTAVGDVSASDVDASAIATSVVSSIATSITEGDSTSVTAAIESLVADAVLAGQTKASGEQGGGKDIGFAIIGAITSGISQRNETVSTSVGTVVTDAIAAGQLKTSGGDAVGLDLANAIASGVDTGPGSTTISTAVTSVVQGAITAGSTAADGATSVGIQIATNAGTGITESAGSLSDKLVSAVNSAVEAARGAGGSAREIGVAIGTALGEGIAAGVAASIATISGAISSALADIAALANVTIPGPTIGAPTLAPGAIDAATTAGGQLSAGLGGGVVAELPTLEAAGAAAATSILEGVDSVGQIHSPSLAMYQRGLAFDEGLALGIEAGTPMVKNVAANLAIETLNALEQALLVRAEKTGQLALENLVHVLETGSDLMVDAAGHIVDQFGNRLMSDFNLISGEFLSANAALAGEVTHMWDDVIEASRAGIASVEPELRTDATDMGATISDATLTGLDGLDSTLSEEITLSVDGGIETGIGAATGATEIGTTIGDSAIDGIRERYDEARAAARDLVKAAQDELTAATTELQDAVREVMKRTSKEERLYGEDFGRNYWEGIMSQVPKTIEAARHITEQAILAANDAAGRAAAAAGGTQLQIDVLMSQMGALDEGDPLRDTLQAQIAALTQQRVAEQSALAEAQKAAANQNITRIQEELAAVTDPARRLELQAQLDIERERLDLWGQMQAAQNALGAAAAGAETEIAQINIDHITAQLDALEQANVESMFGERVATALNAVTTAQDAVAQATLDAATQMKDAAKIMRDELSEVANTGDREGKRAGKGMVDGLNEHAGQFRDKAVEAVDMATLAGVDAGNRAKGVGSHFVSQARDGLTEQTTVFSDVAEKMVSGAIDAASLAVTGEDGVSGAFQIGVDFGQGLIDGIVSMIDVAGQAGADIASAVEAGAAEEAEIESPSQKARRLGWRWGEGLDLGLRERMPDLAAIAGEPFGGMVASRASGGPVATTGGDTYVTYELTGDLHFPSASEFERVIERKIRESRGSAVRA